VVVEERIVEFPQHCTSLVIGLDYATEMLGLVIGLDYATALLLGSTLHSSLCKSKITLVIGLNIAQLFIK
jgi:hypothetical protein